MADKKTEESWEKYLKYIISAFVSVTHVIAFFQIVICSRHLAVAFNIPAKNIGIYFAKLYSLRSLLMSMGCGVEYGIFRIIQTISTSGSGKNGSGGNTAKDVRRYLSMGWFVLLTICEVSFLIVLYSSKNVAYHNYIVLNLEGMLFGFFQMSVLSLIPEFAAYYMLSLYVSGTCTFIIQTIIDRCTKNSMLSVKIQSWICVVCSLICVGLWPVRLFVLTDQDSGKKAEGTQNQSSCSSTTNQGVNGETTESAPAAITQPNGGDGGVGAGAPASGVGGAGGSGSSSSSAEPSTTGGPSTSSNNCGTTNGQSQSQQQVQQEVTPSNGTPPSTPSSPKAQMAYLMSLGSITILKIMTDKLSCLCGTLEPKALKNVQILITRLQQITEERQITFDMLVAIDLVILALKKCQCSESQLCLLAELSLFLRMKVLIKPLEEQTEHTAIEEVSYSYGLLGVKDCKNGGTGEPVVVGAARYTGLIKYVKSQAQKRQKRQTVLEQPRNRRKRSTSGQKSKSEKPFETQLLESLSQLMMFPVGSLVKDFLFPGVIPYGLLERDKCHLINLIVIIFLSIGPVTVFIMQQTISQFKCDNTYIHSFWLCMIPEIIIFFISLGAIHTKQGSTHQIRSSRWRVFIMTMILLTCYGFLETMSFVGMAHYVKFIGDKKYPDLQAIQNVFGKFFRYFVYKFSVGYNKTRIGAGLVLPNFKPPEPIPNTCGFWFKGAFSNGWKDIVGDFRMGIQQYLEVS